MQRLTVLFAIVLWACGDDDAGAPGNVDGGTDGDTGTLRRDAGPATDADLDGGVGGDSDVRSAADSGADSGPGGDAGPTGVCPVGPVGRDLIDDIVAKLMRDALLVTAHAGPGEAAFALSLPGVDEGYVAFASLAFPCTEETWFVPTCSEGMEGEPPSSPFWEGRNRCGRLGCAGPGVVLSDSYVTMHPHTEPDDAHAFVYAMATPAGAEASYDPNAHAVYRIEPIGGERYRVTTAVDRALTVRTGDDVVLQLAHRGQITATNESGALVSAEASITLPDVAPPDALTVSIRVSADGSVEGSIRHGARDVGSYSGFVDPGPEHSWACTD